MAWKSLTRALLAATLALGLGVPLTLSGPASAAIPTAASLQTGVVGYGTVTAGDTTVCQSPRTNGGISTAGHPNEYDCAAFDPAGLQHCTTTNTGPGTSSTLCTVTLTASVVDAGGWAFDHWSGDCSGTSTTCTLAVAETECDDQLKPPCRDIYESVTAIAQFRDTRAPVTSITSGPADHTVVWSQSRSADFDFVSGNEAGEIVSAQCRHDSGGWQDCSFPATWSSIPDGVHTFCVRQYDGSGLASVPACRSWEQEVPVSLGIAASPSGIVTDVNTMMSFQFSTNKTSGLYRCWVDDEPPATCGNPYSRVGAANGEHTLHLALRFTPAAGYGETVDTLPVTYAWTLADTTAPRVTFALPSGRTVTTTPALSYTIDDPLAGVTCTVDDAPLACTPTGAVLPGTPGRHVLRVHTLDRIGNTGDYTWTWDKQAVAGSAGRCTIRLATALRHRRARFTIGCDRAGSGSLGATVKVHGHRRRLAHATVRVPANRLQVITVRVPRGTWKRLKRSHRYRATATLSLGAATAHQAVRVHR